MAAIPSKAAAVIEMRIIETYFDMPEMPPERERTLVPLEARVIYTAMGALPYPEGPFLRLLMLTACRRAEIAGLRWDEVGDDEDGKVLLFPPERTKVAPESRAVGRER